MSATTTIENFELLYLHDSMVTSFEVLTAEARCRLRLHAGAVLRTKGGDKFNPLARYAPALLTVEGVREIAFEGRYQLNATIVDIEARALPDGENVEFVFDLTGGHDADAYFVKLRIVGKGFALGPG
jgi:hypothetical protein